MPTDGRTIKAFLGVGLLKKDDVSDDKDKNKDTSSKNNMKMYTGLNTPKALIAHETHCSLEDKDKDRMT